MFTIECKNLKPNFIYPIVHIWRFPGADLMGGQFSHHDAMAVCVGAVHRGKTKFMQSANTLTYGFTKAQYGWARIEMKKKALTKYGDECKIYNTKEYATHRDPRNVDRSCKNPVTEFIQYYSAKFARFSGAVYFDKTMTIERPKSIDNSNNLIYSNAITYFSIIDVKSDSVKDAVTQSSVDDDITIHYGQPLNKIEKIQRKVMNQIDINIPTGGQLGSFLVEWMQVDDLSEFTVNEIVFRLQSQIESCYESFEMSTFEIGLLSKSGCKSDIRLYPTQVLKENSSSNWEFLISNVESVGDNLNLKKLLDEGVLLYWIVTLYHLERMYSRNNYLKNKDDVRFLGVQTVAELTLVYDVLKTLTNWDKDGIVKETLSQLSSLAYAMCMIKWQVYFGKVYCAFVEQNIWSSKARTDWYGLPIKEKLAILEKINAFDETKIDNNNTYISYLKTDGLQNLFIDVFHSDVNQWKLNDTVKNKYESCWHLPKDWKTQHDKILVDMDEEDKKIQQEKENKKQQKKDKKRKRSSEGFDQIDDAPADKRRKITLSQKAINEFANSCFSSETLSSDNLDDVKNEIVENIANKLPGFIEKQLYAFAIFEEKGNLDSVTTKTEPNDDDKILGDDTAEKSSSQKSQNS